MVASSRSMKFSSSPGWSFRLVTSSSWVFTATACSEHTTVLFRSSSSMNISASRQVMILVVKAG